MKTKKRIALSWHKPKQMLRFSYDKFNGYVLSCGILLWDEEEQSWKNPSKDSWGDEKEYAGLDDLTIRAFTYFREDCDILTHGASIGYDNQNFVELMHVRTMSDTLKRVEKNLERMKESEGLPVNFGQEVNRFARSIGAEGLIFWEGQSSSYREDSYREITLGEIPSHVNYLVNKLYKEEKKNMAA